MRNAQKFILPPHGSFLYDKSSIPEGLEMTRLPFPRTLMEVPFPSKAGNGDTLVDSTKRIILAEEGFLDLHTLVFRYVQVFEVPNAVRITITSWIDEQRKWFVQPTAAIVLFGTKTIPAQRHENDPYAENRLGEVAFVFHPHGILPNMDRLARATQGDFLYQQSASNDLGTEIRILAEMLAVLSCQNVTTEMIDLPRS